MTGNEKVEVSEFVKTEPSSEGRRVSYLSKLDKIDQEAEKRMIRNILFLIDNSDYTITAVSDMLHVNLNTGMKQGFKTGLGVTVVLKAAEIFGVDYGDIIFKDLEKENESKAELKETAKGIEERVASLEEKINELEKRLNTSSEVIKKANALVDLFSDALDKRQV